MSHILVWFVGLQLDFTLIAVRILWPFFAFQIVVTLGLYIHQFSPLNSRLNVSLGVIKYSVMIIDLVYTLLNKTIDLQQDNIENLLILAFHISKLSF